MPGIQQASISASNYRRNKAKGQDETVEKKKRSRRREQLVLKIFLIVVTVAVAAAIGRNMYQRSQFFDKNAKPLSGSSLYGEKAKEQLQNKADLSDFRFRVSGEGEFPEGTRKAGNLFIENPVDNPYRLQVTIKEKKTGEELYRSPLLEPGENVSAFPLKKELPKGKQEAVAGIQAFAKESGNEKALGEITADIHLKVE